MAERILYHVEADARLLRYFLAVAEELNFTRAAEKLHIAQPSLSAQIRQLEKQVGAPLLQRSTHAVSLTEAGRVLFTQGPAVLNGLEQAFQAARDVGTGETGTLRLAYPLSAGHDTAPRLVQALKEAFPRIEVTTEVLPTPNILSAIRDGRADVGIVRAASPAEGARLEELRHDPLGILVSADHPLATKATVELGAVAQHPVVLHPRAANPSHYDFIVALFTDQGLEPEFLERDITFDLTQRFVVSGSASSLVGRSSTAGLPEGMTWIPLAEGVTVSVALVLPAGEHSAATGRFRQIARAYAEAHDWLQ
jgi:DNA-binding transcriptional LysR family regulator